MHGRPQRGATPTSPGKRLVPPAPRVHRITSLRHGATLIDDFAWLRDRNWQAVMRDPGLLDPAIRHHLEQENAYADAVLARTRPLQETLFGEMKGRIKEDDSSVQAPDGPFAYFTRYREGGQHPLICRSPRDGGAGEIILDGDALSAGEAFFRLGATAHSPDHRLLAWSADETGAELFTVRVRDIGSMIDLPDLIPETVGAVTWTQDARAFYYVRLDHQHRPTSVYRHRLGTHPDEDVEIFSVSEGGYFVSLSEVQSRRFAEISVHDHETAEAWLLNLHDPFAMPFLVAPREPDLRYMVEHHPTFGGGDALIIRTNASGAEDFKIAWTPLETPRREHWRDIVPHRQGVYILSFRVLRDWLVRLEREDGLPRIVVRSLGDGVEHSIAFSEEAYSLSLGEGYEFATDNLRLGYSSMATPEEIWDYDLALRTRVLRKRQEVPSGHDPANYVTRRLMAPSHDGETVPISLLHRKDTPLDGTAPALILGYGAYGISIPAGFNTNRLSLVDRGFVYAIAHVRGGTEKGWRWYREGKLSKKQNTFSDFIAATEFLIAQKFVSPEKITAHGGSAGGLLIGAIANQQRALRGAGCRGAVCRRAQHHARRFSAVDPARMARMG